MFDQVGTAGKFDHDRKNQSSTNGPVPGFDEGREAPQKEGRHTSFAVKND